MIKTAHLNFSYSGFDQIILKREANKVQTFQKRAIILAK
jgi:hypothetical protein